MILATLQLTLQVFAVKKMLQLTNSRLVTGRPGKIILSFAMVSTLAVSVTPHFHAAGLALLSLAVIAIDFQILKAQVKEQRDANALLADHFQKHQNNSIIIYRYVNREQTDLGLKTKAAQSTRAFDDKSEKAS
jgi:hypothetical protein